MNAWRFIRLCAENKTSAKLSFCTVIWATLQQKRQHNAKVHHRLQWCRDPLLICTTVRALDIRDSCCWNHRCHRRYRRVLFRLGLGSLLESERAAVFAPWLVSKVITSPNVLVLIISSPLNILYTIAVLKVFSLFLVYSYFGCRGGSRSCLPGGWGQCFISGVHVLYITVGLREPEGWATFWGQAGTSVTAVISEMIAWE